LTANCPADELALTGGWTTDASAHIVAAARGGNGWSVSDSASGTTLSGSVVCLNHFTGASVPIKPPLANVTVAPNAAATVAADCAADEVPIGGGFLIYDALDVFQFHPTADGRGFSLTVANHTMSTPVATIFVSCLSAPKAHLTVPSPVQQTISPQGSGTVQISCPKGTLLSGGGIDLLNGSAVATAFGPSSPTTWQAQVKNQTIVSTTVKLYALCLSFTG
jgi:hypothetical protein